MKRFSYFLLFLILLSCRKNNENLSNYNARELFNKSEELIRISSEKIYNVKDSSELSVIESEFEKKLTEINFSFPPNTDHFLSEQENDSLIKLLNKFKKLKTSKEKELDIRYLNLLDSLEKI